MKKLPLARHADILVQNLGSEALIYDLKTHQAYNLNETSTIVYQACDGKTSFDQLKAKHNFTDELIFLAIDELKRSNLIEEDKSLISPFAGMSRREAIRKAGLGSMVALPVIAALIAPTAIQAQSVSACGTNSCACYFPIGSATTVCTGGDIRFGPCGNNCACRVSRVGCFDQGDGTEFCIGGECITASA